MSQKSLLNLPMLKKKELPKFCEFLEKFNCGPLKKIQGKAEIVISRKLITEENFSSERNPAFFPIWLLLQIAKSTISHFILIGPIIH